MAATTAAKSAATTAAKMAATTAAKMTATTGAKKMAATTAPKMAATKAATKWLRGRLLNNGRDHGFDTVAKKGLQPRLRK